MSLDIGKLREAFVKQTVVNGTTISDYRRPLEAVIADIRHHLHVAESCAQVDPACGGGVERAMAYLVPALGGVVSYGERKLASQHEPPVPAIDAATEAEIKALRREVDDLRRLNELKDGLIWAVVHLERRARMLRESLQTLMQVIRCSRRAINLKSLADDAQKMLEHDETVQKAFDRRQDSKAK